MAETGTSTATLRLTIGDLKIAHPVTVPAGRVTAVEILPALQALVNEVVNRAEEAERASTGRTVSCRKGCGACCRQLVPISRTEGEGLLRLIAALPPARRAEIERRFAAAEQALRAAGLSERGPRSDRELSVEYFAQRLPCPFLEDESCSIHPDRPLVCREYLVTSPPHYCAGPMQEGVAPSKVPKLSLAARKLADDEDDWFPLTLLMDWMRRNRRRAERRTGPEWIQRFLQRLSVR